MGRAGGSSSHFPPRVRRTTRPLARTPRNPLTRRRLRMVEESPDPFVRASNVIVTASRMHQHFVVLPAKPKSLSFLTIINVRASPTLEVAQIARSIAGPLAST